MVHFEAFAHQHRLLSRSQQRLWLTIYGAARKGATKTAAYWWNTYKREVGNTKLGGKKSTYTSKHSKDGFRI